MFAVVADVRTAPGVLASNTPLMRAVQFTAARTPVQPPMDWQTMVGRRAKKDTPDKGGWNMFLTAVVAPDTWNPIANFGLSGACDKAWFGWACDDKLEQLRGQFARSVDDGEKKKLAGELQARGFEIGTHAPVGEYIAPSAVRKGVKGLVIGPGDFYWNIRKD